MLKDAFTPCDDIYLLNHSVGRMPVSARSHLEQRFFTPWESGQPDAWPQWLDSIAEFNQALAKLFNSSADAFCPQTNLSSALTKIIQALPPKPGKNVIVLTENDFPSVGFVLNQATRLGYKLKLLPNSKDVQDPDTWAAAFTDDVHSALITHVHFNTSKLIPVAEITRLARQREVSTVVDIAQSGGIVPIDFQQWQADAIIGSCVKWLCGGPGAGFLWIDPTVIEQLKPVDVGWFSHQNPFEFDIHHFDYADTSARFWGGTPSVLPFAVASNSINLINSIGIETIREHNQFLTEKIISHIAVQNLQTPRDANQRGGTLVLKFNNQQKTVEALNHAGVLFDMRPLGLRLSPHIYNTEQEIDKVIACLRE